MDLQKLEDFVEDWNDGYFDFNDDKQSRSLAITHGVSSENSFINQYLDKQERKRIGVSELGKPAVLLGLKRLNFPQEKINAKSLFNFHYGDWFESLILTLLKCYGCQITHEQLTIDFYGLEGHIDGCYNGEVVLEIKTLSGYNYNKFSRPINAHKPWFRVFNEDIHGYATQLGCYCKSLGMPGVWLTLNKETRELALVKQDGAIANEGFNRAIQIIEALDRVNYIEDLVSEFDPPDPEQEFYRKQPTGYYKLPETMRYSEYAPCFYELVLDKNGYGKETQYVNRVLTPEEIVSELELAYDILVNK